MVESNGKKSGGFAVMDVSEMANTKGGGNKNNGNCTNNGNCIDNSNCHNNGTCKHNGTCKNFGDSTQPSIDNNIVTTP